MNTRLRTLGSLELEGSDLTRPTPLLLLAYLSLEGPQERGHLAALFWPGAADRRKSLGVALSQVRRGAPEAVDLDGARLVARVETDVAAFLARLERDAPDAALELYRGPFLDGVRLRGWGEELEEWVDATRVRLAGHARIAHLALGEREAGRGAFARGARHAEDAWRLRGSDLPEGDDLARLHRLLLAGGSAYAADVAREAEDVGIVVDGAADAARAELRAAAPAPVPAGRPPAFATTFVGRAQELDDVARMLRHEPDCRLLTLLGPGGVGKTRLATEAAAGLADAFPDGVAFVALAPVASPAAVLGAVAAALDLRFHREAPPERQLLDYLRGKRLLLVLDNVEHVLDGMAFLAEVSQGAPEVRVLATSRASLRLQEEWLYPLAGLGWPRGDAPAPRAPGAPDGDDALLLFDRCARRARPGFVLEPERARVARVCRAVDGNPLAIELAAGWLGMLPLDEIERELERGIDILASRHRDVPERHRSMRAVLEASWRLLGGEEQRVLARLSVFRGTFRRADAERVARTSLPVLATLVGKSLLEALGTGRYGLHELLRQFAAERLADDPPDESATRDGHGAHHLGLLSSVQPLLDGAGQRQALDEIAANLGDVEAAWAWALAQGDLAALGEALAVASDVYGLLGRPQQGAAIVEGLRSELERSRAVRTPAGEALHARALVHQGALAYLVGRYEVAEASVATALERSLPPDRAADVALAHLVAGMVAAWQGREAQAEACIRRSLTLGEAIADAKAQARALRELSLLHASYGDYERGRDLGRRGLALARELGRPDLVALLLDVLVWPNACLGRYDEAEAYGRQGLEILERSGNRWGVAQMLGSLGWVDYCRGRLDDARSCLERCLVVAREVGARLSIANHLGDLALVETARGDPERAQELAREGLQIALELESPLYVAYHRTALGGAAVALGSFAEARRHLLAAVRLTHEARLEPQCLMALCDLAAVELADARAPARPAGSPVGGARALLAVVVEHPKTWAVVRTRAGALTASLPDDGGAAAQGSAGGGPDALDAVVVALLRDLGGDDGSSFAAP